MRSSWLDSQNTWLIVAILLLMMTLAADAAFRVGRRMNKNALDAGKGHFGSVLGSLLGLLALLLSFTFGMATQRYEARRLLMIEDAGTIGTLYMRSSLLPEPERLKFKPLLREYLDLRPQTISQLGHPKEFENTENQSRALLTKMFAVSREMAQAVPPVKGSDDLIKAYLDVLVSQARRLSALSNRVPDSIIWMLLGAATIGMVAIGYSAGLGNHRGMPARILLSVLVCGTIYVVIDLDRPHNGLMSVDQAPIIHLQQVIDQDPETQGSNPMTKGQLANLTSGRFFWLLLMMIAGIVLAALAPSGPAGTWVSGIALIGILIAGIYAARGGATRLIVSVILTGILFAVWAFYMVYVNRAAQYGFLVILLVCLLFNLITTLSFVLTTGRVGPDHIYGAICTYVLIAMSFATIYTIQDLAMPGAFSGVHTGGPTDLPWEDMLYFSITTLSTVGYGDITPLHRSARAICSVEMLTGTFYVAVLIARLAGLYPPPARDSET